jgi:hypothetical protein
MYPLFLFVAPTEEGQELARQILERVPKLGYSTVIIEEPTQAKLNSACFSNQVVIFDATVDLNGSHLYHAATAQPMAMDQILVVSRTYLPINFPGLRQGGAPAYPSRFTNDDILRWLDVQLAELKQTEPREKLGFFGYFRAMFRSLDQAKARLRRDGQIFISYRSRSFPEVNILARRIASGGFHGEPKTVKIVPPGALAYEDELLTSHRRWMLLVTIEAWITAAEEIWIYETDDYYNSWWTQGEVVHTLYGFKDPLSHIRVFNPSVGMPRRLEAPELPQLSENQKKRLARLEANANPATMGPEGLKAMEEWRKVPLLGRMHYFNDKVWSDEFNFWPLMQCNACCAKASANGPDRVDIEGFLECKTPLLHKLEPSMLLDVLHESREFNCPGCGATFELNQAPPRFLWYANRYGRATGPDGAAIVEIPCFRARSVR